MTPLRVVAYINGVRFYPRSFTYAAQVGGYHRFSLDVPAVKEWNLLSPRSHAVIFIIDPVTTRWRLMCEGEYVGMARSKSGDGNRNLSLQFEGLHGVWKEITYTNIATLMTGQVNPTEMLVSARANGKRLDLTGNSPTNTLALNKVIDQVTSKFTRFSAFLPELVRMVVRQQPVDSYYMYARQWVRKMFALADADIGFIFDQVRAQDMLVNNVNQFGLPSNSSLADLISQYEAVAMYQHVPVPCPPIYGKPDELRLIPEVMFLPQMYYTVPPACNVIFQDQYSMYSTERNFRMEPTRVISELATVPEVSQIIPKLYMANSSGGDDVVRNMSNQSMPPGFGLTHDLLSPEELNKGVISRKISLSIEKLLGPSWAQNKVPASFESWMDFATRQSFEIERSRFRTASISLAWQPYVLPGFPCIIEDSSGPLYGMVESVQHSLSAVGEPSTAINVVNVHALYALEGMNRTPFLPTWLNHLFYPDKISATLKKLFGPNQTDGRSAMVPDAQLVPEKGRFSQIVDGEQVNTPLQRVNMDKLAAMVIPVPSYTKEGRFIPPATGDMSVAERIRTLTPVPQIGFLQFQYRAGCSLDDFVKFHGLENTADGDDPPKDLSPSPKVNRLFAAPYNLRYTGTLDSGGTGVAEAEGTFDVPSEDATQYGAYELVKNGSKLLSDERQQIARRIQEAIDQMATVN